MTKFIVYFLFALTCSCASAQINPPPHNPPYPQEWWAPVNDPNPPDWERLPQSAKYGEVILSKRNELGIFSNFAPTAFTYHGKTYASVEGFWQATKYPEDKSDPRLSNKVKWPHTRAEVEQMTAFDAKHAGEEANTIMNKLKIDWVTFEGQRMVYHAVGDTPFYALIKEVMMAKLQQHPEAQELLKKTGDLKLVPDHDPGPEEYKAWQFHQIWMEYRQAL